MFTFQENMASSVASFCFEASGSGKGKEVDSHGGVVSGNGSGRSILRKKAATMRTDMAWNHVVSIDRDVSKIVQVL